MSLKEYALLMEREEQRRQWEYEQEMLRYEEYEYHKFMQLQKNLHETVELLNDFCQILIEVSLKNQ